MKEPAATLMWMDEFKHSSLFLSHSECVCVCVSDEKTSRRGVTPSSSALLVSVALMTKCVKRPPQSMC